MERLQLSVQVHVILFESAFFRVSQLLFSMAVLYNRLLLAGLSCGSYPASSRHARIPQSVPAGSIAPTRDRRPHRPLGAPVGRRHGNYATARRPASVGDHAVNSADADSNSTPNAAFINCTFTACSLFDTTFTGCKCVGSIFDRCTYELIRVNGGNWSCVGVSVADLRADTYRKTHLREANLTGAMGHGASLREVDFPGASLDDANCTDCDLRGSD